MKKLNIEDTKAVSGGLQRYYQTAEEKFINGAAAGAVFGVIFSSRPPLEAALKWGLCVGVVNVLISD